MDLPELHAIERVIEVGGSHLRSRVAGHVKTEKGSFPIPVVTMGNPDSSLPGVGYFGGVHGLEKIGTSVVTAYMQSLVMRLKWDTTLHRLLDSVQLVFMPIVNPGGMTLNTRSNPNGVDLMRNAPVDAFVKVPFLLGGHRLSSKLPWYRGGEGLPMELESQALCDVVQEELLNRPFSIAVDCHSGFGLRDRIWFPFAHSRTPIANLPELQVLMQIFTHSNNQHRYVIEPQSRHYLTHGDLWDYLYLKSCTTPGRTFLPLTLEMGSWIWVKKNFRQMFSRHGLFNPLIEHRQQRVLRQHQVLLDFLSRASSSYQRWVPQPENRAFYRDEAEQAWYR